jgi:prepilin-type N-terminal cleavage/methylation domain-containing protein
MKTGPMTNIQSRRSSGFSMVELLIAVIIIGILVTIIVPVLTNRAADARLAAAKADLEAIANAQSQVAIDTGYVVRLHVLDDSGAIGDNFGSDDPNDVIDSIRDEDANNASQPQYIFLDARSGVAVPNGNVLFQRVEANPESVGWRGPYLSFQRKYTPANPPPVSAPWTFGSPLDPWGNPYFLFVAGQEQGGTAAVGGWIDEQNISIGGPPSPQFTWGGASSDATNFDRNTLVSLGPNGLAGDGTVGAPVGTGDDLTRAF